MLKHLSKLKAKQHLVANDPEDKIPIITIKAAAVGVLLVVTLRQDISHKYYVTSQIGFWDLDGVQFIRSRSVRSI